MNPGYSRSEMVWLLSLTREQAVDMDAVPRDSCAGLSPDPETVRGGGGESPMPVIARWIDVQRARGEIVKEKEGLAILQLRASGFSERELAKLMGRDRLAVRRRWLATVDEIIDRLGRHEPDEALSRPSMCMSCGEKPRVRLAAVTRRVKGGWRTITPERQASVCLDCLNDDELRQRALAA